MRWKKEIGENALFNYNIIYGINKNKKLQLYLPINVFSFLFNGIIIPLSTAFNTYFVYRIDVFKIINLIFIFSISRSRN